MIVTKQKDFDGLLKNIANAPVFIIGCSECSTVCHTGGEEEVLQMKDALNKKNILVTGWTILDPACNLQNDKRLLRKYEKEIDKAKKILILSCGSGAQTISKIIDNIEVVLGTDTLFLGEILRLSDFEKRCNMCGDCIQDQFGGVCPVSRCPKSMLNGPCGGLVDGKCEVDKNLDCVWDIISKRLKNTGKIENLKEIRKPKNWSKSNETRRVL